MTEPSNHHNGIYADHDVIVNLVDAGSKVIDLGCGKGKLLDQLIEKKKVQGCGVDIDENNIITCVEKGLTVFQANLDAGLVDFPDKSYDYVILNRTIQEVQKPHQVIREMLRVGKRVIVGFPNFGTLRLLVGLFFRGRMPKSKLLPFEWYDTPNIHLLTINDFKDYCKSNGIHIHRQLFIRNNRVLPARGFGAAFANYLVDEAIFVISTNPA